MKNLKKLFLTEKPDIVLSYTIKPVIYASIAAKKANVSNINAMITGVGYLFTSSSIKANILKFFGKKLYKYGLKCAHNVIFQNKDDLSDFVNNGLVKKEKVKLVNGSGINMEHFTKVGFPSQITFFMLSRTMVSKGVKEYLDAAKEIKKKYNNIKFILLGALENIQDSLNFEYIKPYIDEGIIDYYGETDDVRKFFEKCSVYVLPSYREGTPRTVLEAMAMGRPIITTDVPGCRETVIDNETGYLVKPKSVFDLVCKMEYFIKNPKLIVEMGNKSYLYCKEKFEVNKVNKNMLEHMDIYKE